MKTETIDKIISILKKEVAKFPVPAVGRIAAETADPFRILISCLLSLRTRDEVTEAASDRLFHLAATPQSIATLHRNQIEKAIYPVSFYRNKTGQILSLSKMLLQHYNGNVPKEMDDLLRLPGVGRKTANLVLTVGFGQYGICVDTHVHRISNRLGLIKTKTANESEMALYETLPKRYWMTYNDILVPYGQFICRPISPFCGGCKIAIFCSKVGITTSR